MKHLLFLFLVLFLISCNGSDAEKEQACQSQTEICPIDSALYPDDLFTNPDTELPNEAFTFATNLSLANFNADQEDKIFQAVELIKQVVASKEFRQAIIEYTYNGQQTYVDNKGLTNTQIYNKLLQGAEVLNPYKNNSMEVELVLYYEASTTIGYTYPSSKRIWMNTKYFSYYTPAQVAGNLMHEWLHKLGFGHDSQNSPSRSSSVPYAIGYIMQRLARQLEE